MGSSKSTENKGWYRFPSLELCSGADLISNFSVSADPWWQKGRWSICHPLTSTTPVITALITSLLCCSEGQWDMALWRCWSLVLQDQPLTACTGLTTTCGQSKPLTGEIGGLSLCFGINQVNSVTVIWKSTGSDQTEWSEVNCSEGFVTEFSHRRHLAISGRTNVTEKLGYCFRGDEF